MIRKILHYAFEESRDLHERVYRLVSIFAILVCVLLFFMGWFIRDSIIEQIILIAGIFVFIIITIVSYRHKAASKGAALISLIFSFIMLPLMFFNAGGLYGEMPVLFVLGFAYICLVFPVGRRSIILALACVDTIICYIIGYNEPRLVVQHTVSSAYIDSAVAVVLFGVLTNLLIQFQNRTYKNENELVKRQKSEIEELNASQNRFFSSMSHEIRTPINSIIGFNEMTLRSNAAPDIKENAVNIQSASNMLLALINDILDMSKIESGNMDIVDVDYELSTLISELVNLIWVRADSKNLEFRVEADPELPDILHGDEVRIKQVLINILNNAVKYTAEGSVVMYVRGERIDDDNYRIIYSVSDTGIGIKRENMPYLFDAFRRMDEKRNRTIEGTGLGLMIVRQLIELMGGEITVDSVYTKGSTFTISLPQKVVGNGKMGVLNLETRSVLDSMKDYRQSFEAPDARILIVDDNEMNLNVACKLLESTKVQIDVAGSGRECLELTLNNYYHGILMDHIMPDMDGIETLNRVREQEGGMSKSSPVIALTANAGSDAGSMYKREGFDGYLAKPVNGTLLEAAVLSMLPNELVTVSNDIDNSESGGGRLFVNEGKRKVPIKITIDSVGDMTEEMTEKYNIAVLPYYVCTPEGKFLDGKEISTESLIEYINIYGDGKSVQSKPPKLGDYERFFAEQLMEAEHIIHISIAKSVSKGYSIAKEAAEEFDNVEIVDSGQVSGGMSIIALEAVKLIERGAGLDSILTELNRISHCISASCVVRNTYAMLNSGRITQFMFKFFETMMVSPVISFANNKLRVRRHFMGSYNAVLRKYIKSVLRHRNRIDSEYVFVTYVDLSEDEMRIIKELLDQNFDNVYYQKASAVVASNCGSGALGLIYKER